jgi:hypothetical protein
VAQSKTTTSEAGLAWVYRVSDSLARREWLVYVAVAVLTVVATTLALDLWKMNWHVPLVYNGDGVLIAAHIKTDIETGWYESQSLLGAPFGQVYHDWKSADNLHHIFAAVLGWVIKDYGVVMNLYYLLGYLFAGLTGAWFLRLVGVSRLFSIVLGVAFAIAPYHFIRSESHMWLSAYYPIPLALGVVYLLARGLPVWTKNARFENRLLAWTTGRAAFTVVALALVGTANSYYGFWTVLFIAFVGLGRLIYDHSWRRFVGAVVAGVWTVIVMVVNMAPDLVYSAINGANNAAVGRFPVESEIYSLKLLQLILPQSGHRVHFLSMLRSFYDNTFPFTSEAPALGVVAAFGFLAALAIVAYAVLTFGVRRQQASPLLRSLGVLSSLALFAFVLSTLGGFSSLIALFTSDLRGWNRMSIFIAMLALGVTGLILDAVVRRVTARVRSEHVVRVVAAAVSAVLLLVAYADQVSPTRVPPYAANQAAFDQDEAMVTAIEEAVPADSMILQLPFRLFPESSGPNGVPDTDQLLPYLHSDTLRWSGAGIKGRPASLWSGLAATELSTPALVYSATAAGFAGVLFDRKSYADDTATPAEESLIETLGEPVYRSPDDRYAFFTTEAADEVLTAELTADQIAAIGDDVVNPVLPTYDRNYTSGYSVIDSLKPYRPKIVLTNPRDSEVEIQVSLTLSYRQGAATANITLPDGSVKSFDVGPDPRAVSFTVTAPAGATDLPVVITDGSAPVIDAIGDAGPVGFGDLVVRDVDLIAKLRAISGLSVLPPVEGSTTVE